MGPYPRMLEQKVDSLPLRDPPEIPPDTPVRDALTAMREKKLGCAVVVDSGGHPIGVFTEDRFADGLLRSPGFLEETVESHLSPSWVSLRADAPIAELVRSLRRQSMRFAVVTNDLREVVGLTGQMGLMEFIAEHAPTSVLGPVQRVGEAGLDRQEGE